MVVDMNDGTTYGPFYAASGAPGSPGPQGERGSDGAMGSPGQQGPPGNDGRGIGDVRDCGDGRVVDFVHLEANRAACAYLGLDRRRLLEQTLVGTFPGIAESGLLALYATAADGSEPVAVDDFAYDNEILGLRRRYDIRAARVGTAVSVTWRDVTDRLEAEGALRRRIAELRSLQRLSALLTGSQDLAAAIAAACALLAELFEARSASVHLLPDAAAPGAARTEYAGVGPDDLAGRQLAAVASALTRGRLAEADGEDGSRLLAMPLVAEGETLGVLAVVRGPAGTFDDHERDVARAAAEVLAGVVRADRLRELETAQAAADARQRLARDLHDAVSQNIYSANLIAEMTPAVWDQDPERGRRDLQLVQRLIRAALAEMRTLLFELRPETLAATPIEALLRNLSDALRGEMPVGLSMQAVDLPDEVRMVFYRVAQEALSNVAKHAGAARAWIVYGPAGDGAKLVVRDDGTGLAPRGPGRGGMGLAIMRERAASVGAGLTVETGPAGGTVVTLSWRPPAAPRPGAGEQL